jgi:hypothetical protein
MVKICTTRKVSPEKHQNSYKCLLKSPQWRQPCTILMLEIENFEIIGPINVKFCQYADIA